MHADQYHEIRRAQAAQNKGQKVDPMWAADEHERRLAIFERAAAGARQTLRGKL